MSEPIDYSFDDHGHLDAVTFPKRLYKHFRINRNFISAAQSSALWFSTRDQFNDLFDCNQLIDCTASQKEYFQYITKYWHAEKSRPQRLNIAAYMYRNLAETVADFRAVTEEEIAKSGICSFTTTPTNQQMWAHYSDSNLGVCVEFDFACLADVRSTSERLVPMAVQYLKEPTKFQYIKRRLLAESPERFALDFDRHVFATKGIGWSYESEVRLFSPKSGLIRVDPKSFVRVIFGARVPASTIDETKEVLLKSFGSIAFSKAVPNRFSQSIEISDI